MYTDDDFKTMLNDARKQFETIENELMRESFARVQVFTIIVDKSTKEQSLHDAARFHAYLIGLDLYKTFCKNCVEKMRKQANPESFPHEKIPEMVQCTDEHLRLDGKRLTPYMLKAIVTGHFIEVYSNKDNIEQILHKLMFEFMKMDKKNNEIQATGEMNDIH